MKKRIILLVLVFLVFSVLDILFFVSGVFAQNQDVCFEEEVPLFSQLNKIEIDSPLNINKKFVTSSDLPSILENGKLFGNVEKDYTQLINIGSYPKVINIKQFDVFDERNYKLQLDINTDNYLYRESVIFTRAVDFENSALKGQKIKLFGRDFVIVGSDANTLILSNFLEIDFSSDKPLQTVKINNIDLTIEFRSSSDTSVTVMVKDNKGNSKQIEINEDSLKHISIFGLGIYVQRADETIFGNYATLSVGSVVDDQLKEIILADGLPVRIRKIGKNEDVVEGTKVTFIREGGIYFRPRGTCPLKPGEGSDIIPVCVEVIDPNDPTKVKDFIKEVQIDVTAPDSDHNFILPGRSFTDPIFKSFKVDFRKLDILKDNLAYADIYITTNFCHKNFVRGDVDANGKFELTDAIMLLSYLFQGGKEPKCLDSADVDDSGGLDLSDVIYLLTHLFQGGKAPPAPYPDFGVDSTADGLGCNI